MTASAKKDLLQKVWLKAFQDGEFEMKFPDKATMHRVRMGLYNAVKGKDLAEEIRMAKEECELRIVDETTIRLERGDKSRDVELVRRLLGEKLPQTQLDRDVEEMQKRAVEKAVGGGALEQALAKVKVEKFK
jgi:hypothetical protein